MRLFITVVPYDLSRRPSVASQLGKSRPRLDYTANVREDIGDVKENGEGATRPGTKLYCNQHLTIVINSLLPVSQPYNHGDNAVPCER